MKRTLVFLVFALTLTAAEPRAVFPPNVKPIGPFSPGVVAGGLMYVSGQGARDGNNNLPQGSEAQIRQCLDNVKSILAAEKLTLQHVIAAQVFLADIKDYETLNRIWAGYFPNDPPTRSVIGTARMPAGTPVEINAVAVVNLARKKVLRVPGTTIQEPVSVAIDTGDRVYLGGGIGRDSAGSIPKDPREQVRIMIEAAEAALKPAGLQIRNLIYVNIYVDAAMPMAKLAELIDDAIADETARTIVQTTSLPFGAQIQISGVAARNAERLGGHCSTVAETVYCSGRVGTIRQTLETLKADLAVAKMGLENAVSTNVYIDNLDQFAEMNKVYATFFGKVAPSRTTVQPWKEVQEELSLPAATGVASKDDNSPRALVSVIAVR